MSEAEKISAKFEIDLARVEEGLAVKRMIEGMPTVVEAGSKWYVLDMQWVKAWQEYIYYDIIVGNADQKPSVEPEMPDYLEWERITKPVLKKDLDPHKDLLWQQVELKDNLLEGQDFFLVTPEIFEFAKTYYGI